MNAIELLSDIIAQGTTVSAVSYRSMPGCDWLVQHGYLQEAGIISSVQCSECDTPHDAEILFEGDRYGYFCPELGFVPLELNDLTGLTPNLSSLVERLADGFSARRRKATPLHGQTWRIGAVETDHGNVMLYFHPCLQSEEDARGLTEALAREMKSPWQLVVTATGRLPVEGLVIGSLVDLVGLDEGDGRLVTAIDLHAALGIPQSKKSGRPSHRGPQLKGLIQERIINNQALPGRNEEAEAVLGLFEKNNPGSKPPSLSSVKDYVTKVRSVGF